MVVAKMFGVRIAAFVTSVSRVCGRREMGARHADAVVRLLVEIGRVRGRRWRRVVNVMGRANVIRPVRNSTSMSMASREGVH